VFREIWFETDERTEVAKALEMLERMLDLVVSDPYYWKWAIITLHNAVQGAIVCSISGSAGLGALRPHIATKWLKVYRAGTGDYPDLELDAFPNLYARMKVQFGYVPPSSVDESIAELNTFRNRFVHFVPAGWAIMANGLPGMARDCLGVVGDLAWDTRRFSWYDEDEGQRARLHYERCLNLLERLHDTHFREETREAAQDDDETRG